MPRWHAPLGSLLAVLLAGQFIGLTVARGQEPKNDSERRTQPAADASAPADITARDLIRVQAEPADHPWLSVLGRGHAASVRAIAFTPDDQRLCTAGLDKVVHVWDTRVALRDLRRTWLIERTLRWQVGRGLRGSIYALAIAPSDGTLAFAGYGASGGLGEIVIADPVRGTTQQVLVGHQQTVAALAFSPDGQWLASQDVAGEVRLWKRSDGTSRVIRKSDAEAYSPKINTAIARFPPRRPLAFLGNDALLLGVVIPSQPSAKGQLLWNLARIPLDASEEPILWPTAHAGMVTALATNLAGTRAASADMTGRLWHWQVDGRPVAKPVEVPAVVLSMSFAGTGDRLAVGTSLNAQTRRSRLIVFAGDLSVERQQDCTEIVQAVAFSTNGSRVAWAADPHHGVQILDLEVEKPAALLAGAGRQVVKVAFAEGQADYRLGLGTTRTGDRFNEYGKVEAVFDPPGLKLSRQLGDARWRRDGLRDTKWSAVVDKAGRLQLREGNAARGLVPLVPERDGRPQCYAWIVNQTGAPAAVAVGTDLQNGILVYKVVSKGSCSLLRHFRGHADRVNSLAVSTDQRYLASGSADGTVRVWSLAELFQPAARGTWGAEFKLEADDVVVAAIHPASPLFYRGVRAGDTLPRASWLDAQGQAVVKSGQALLKQLASGVTTTQILFEFERQGNPRKPFQGLPAWHPLASLYVNREGDWTWWTPEGYYDASINGQTLFGWTVNRGLESPPDFFRADQFRNLERPDVLEHLLTTGSLDQAFGKAAAAPPAEPDDVVSAQVRVTPRVRILTPLAPDLLQGGTALVRAQIDVPTGSDVTRVRLFANGVVAPREQLIAEKVTEGGRELTYEWQAPLPREPRHLLQVVANTVQRTAGLADAVVDRTLEPDPPARRPRLFLVAVGIDTYADPSVQPLEWSVADAQAVVKQFELGAGGLFEIVPALVLTNEQVTRSTWQATFAELASRLQQDAGPDDLLVIFLAGHGFLEPKTDEYFYASYDIKRDDFLAGKFEGSISWRDFELLADVPCRKLAILDTCHSGAIQPLSERGLKSAVRGFQEDVVLTVTASLGHERSEENKAWKHGAFTRCLLEALEGRSDTSGDGVVSLNEAVDYVQRSVPELTAGRQNPTAGPAELLPYVSLGLTQVGSAASP